MVGLLLLSIPFLICVGIAAIRWMPEYIAKSRRRRVGGVWYRIRDQASYTSVGWTRELEDGDEVLEVEDYTTEPSSLQSRQLGEAGPEAASNRQVLSHY